MANLREGICSSLHSCSHSQASRVRLSPGELNKEQGSLRQTIMYNYNKPVNPKGSQPWIFIVRTDAEAEAPILWPPDAKNWLIGKDPDVGKDWRHKEKGMTEDEIVGLHCWINRHEFEQTLGDGEGQGGLMCCSPWGHGELDMTEELNWTEFK